MTRAFLDFNYRAQLHYIHNLVTEKTIDLDWHRAAPDGVSKIEHYQHCVKNLLEVIKGEIEHEETSILFIPSNFLIILGFSDLFVRTEPGLVAGFYAAGTLKGITVVVSPEADRYTLMLFDLLKADKVTKIKFPED